MNQLPIQQPSPQVEPARPDIPLVFVTFDKTGLAALRQQIDADLQRTDWSPVPILFARWQLLDLQRLLMLHPNRQCVQAHEPIRMSDAQRRLLLAYVRRYCRVAAARNEFSRQWVLEDCQDALTINATLVPPVNPSVSYGNHSAARPLAVLWNRLCAVFTGRNRRERPTFQTVY